MHRPSHLAPLSPAIDVSEHAPRWSPDNGLRTSHSSTLDPILTGVTRRTQPLGSMGQRVPSTLNASVVVTCPLPRWQLARIRTQVTGCVEALVIRVRQDLKVLGRVVQRVAVAVMNVLVRTKWTTQELFHDNPVFVTRTCQRHDLPVSLMTVPVADGLGSFGLGMTSTLVLSPFRPVDLPAPLLYSPLDRFSLLTDGLRTTPLTRNKAGLGGMSRHTKG